VNCIAPGTVKTRFSSLLWKDEKASDFSRSRTHLGRLADQDELGGAAAFVCSDDASYMTGETLTVAGGMSSSL